MTADRHHHSGEASSCLPRPLYADDNECRKCWLFPDCKHANGRIRPNQRFWSERVWGPGRRLCVNDRERARRKSMTSQADSGGREKDQAQRSRACRGGRGRVCAAPPTAGNPDGRGLR